MIFASVCCLLALIGCEALGPQRNYVGLTKSQIVEKLGFPAAIDVLDNKPAAEYWVYYQKVADGGIEPKYLAFSFSGKVESQYSDINPRAFASIQNPEDRAKIIAYRKAWLKRDEGR